MDKIYTFEFLRSLFDQMADSYDRVNYVTSFGFSRRFRPSVPAATPVART